MRIPQIKSLETAISLYYTRIELSSSDIKSLFAGGRDISSSTVSRLKKLAREQMIIDEVMPLNAVCVNTRSAYKAWGLDVSDLENRYLKLKALELPQFTTSG